MDFAGGRIYVIQSLDIDVMSEPPASLPGERPGGPKSAVAGEDCLVKYAHCSVSPHQYCSNVMPSRKIGAGLTSELCGLLIEIKII